MIETNFNDKGRVAVDNEECIIAVIGEIEWMKDWTKTVDKSLNAQVEDLDFIISLVIQSTEGNSKKKKGTCRPTHFDCIQFDSLIVTRQIHLAPQISAPLVNISKAEWEKK